MVNVPQQLVQLRFSRHPDCFVHYRQLTLKYDPACSK